jgi:non-ribosomal peptide synthetase component F
MTTLVLMWADAVRRYGDRPAVQHDDVTLSYAELDRYANTIAWHLHRRGLRPEDRVAVCLPRGVDVLAAILGVLKAGGAYVAVDPRYPDARRDLMVEASGAVTTLTEAELPDRAAAEDGPPAVEVGPAHAACVLFTSGSSGTPKAVVLEHRNV